jgi:glutamyl-tRNA synthetase
MQEGIRVRIAPSPTGEPHVGTAYVALFNKVFAHRHGGKFILRIEDTDQTRSRKVYEDQILAAMRWLGLDYDEGPDIGGPYAPYRQSERLGIYKKYAEELVQKESAYYCFCTTQRLDHLREEQKELQKTNKEIRLGYDGHCRKLSLQEARRRVARGEAYVIRLKIDPEGETAIHDLLRPDQKPFQHKEIDDQVLLKTDGYPTYHLANVVDDHLMKITHVIRAEEWITSTPKHLLLYKAFGWKSPQFAHLNLLRNADGSKISKRKNPTSLLYYKEEGFLPEALLNFLANHSYTFPEANREIFTIQEMQDLFEFSQMATGSPVFDLQKLRWMNGEYLRKLPPQELKQRLLQHLEPKIDKVLPHLQVRLKVLSDAFDKGMFYFYGGELELTAESLIPKKKKAQDCVKVLEDLLKSLRGSKKVEGVQVWEPALLEAIFREFAESLEEWGTSDFFMLIRTAITGSTQTPPLFDCMELLGKERSLARLENALQLLKKVR